MIIAFYLGHKEVGYFVGLTKIIEIPVSMLNPINQTLFNHSVKKHNLKLDISYLKKTLFFIPFAFLVGSIVLYLLFQFIVNIYLGHEYLEYGSSYGFIAFAPFVISISSILGFQYFLASGKRKEFSIITMIGSIISLFLCTYGTKNYGIRGTFISYIIIESIISIMMLIKFIIEVHKTSQSSHL
jgi:O-antigen/teichoic acid export membrane protein